MTATIIALAKFLMMRHSPHPTGPVYAILFAVAACHLLNDTLQAVLLAIYPILQESYALSFTQIGVITAVFQLTGSVLQPLIGAYTDRRPQPYSLPLAPLCTFAGILLLGLAHSYGMVLLAATVIGVGSAIFHPEASRVTRLSAGGRYGLAQSIFQTGGNLGTALGPLLAAAIILGHGQTSVLWFCVLALIAIIILSLVGRWYQAHLISRKKNPRPALESPFPPRLVVFSLVILVLLLFSKFVYMASLGSFYTFYLIETFHISIGQSQLCLFVFLGSVAVGTVIGGPIGDWIGRKTVIWFSILGTLPFSLALPHANLFWTVVLTVPIGLILSSAFSAMIVYAQELLPAHVGMVSGLFFGLAFGMGGLGATLVGHLADTHGIAYVYQLCAFLPAIGLLAIFLPNQRRATPHHP